MRRLSDLGERVTMTINGLSKMNALIILAFGEKKQAAVSGLFEEGPIEQLPVSFIKNKDIAAKTILIMDREKCEKTICKDQPTLIPAPFVMVIFGVTGDLSQNKLMPSLFSLFKQQLFPEEFSIIGFPGGK